MKIKLSGPTVRTRDLGQFTVKSGAIRFTDPCYDNDVWCKGSMPALNGQWQARIGFFRDEFDARNLLESIDQLYFYRDFKSKFGDSEHIDSFTHLVSTARDHGKWGSFQKIDKLFELIAEEKDAEKYARLMAMAEYSVAWFNPRYKGEEYHYWEKDLWLLFEISSAFSSDSSLRMFTRGAHRILIELNKWLDDTESSEEEKNKNIEALQKALKAEKIDFETAINARISELQDIYDSGKPYRTHFLHIKHESLPEYTANEDDSWLENDQFDVGVDSGQAGFFDEGWYADEYGGSEDDAMYGKLCSLSSGGDSYRNADKPEKEQGGAFEFGCNSYTAHGDGSAPLYYRANDKGEVIEAVYHYDIEWKEEDEE